MQPRDFSIEQYFFVLSIMPTLKQIIKKIKSISAFPRLKDKECKKETSR